MQMNEVDFAGRVPIDSYGPGFFRVDGKIVDGNILMVEDGARAWAGLDDMGAVVEAFGGMDVVFFGMGADIAMLPDAARRMLAEAGVAFEVMGTAAACRTFNILLSEGRNVGAALLALPADGT